MMINKETIDRFANALLKALHDSGNVVQSVSYQGDAVEVVVTIVANNTYDRYVISAVTGNIVWYRLLTEEEYMYAANS
jgi:hypothetical protein